MRIEDTGDNMKQPSWFAIDDINAKAEAAYERHKDFFDSSEHKELVEGVERILRPYAKSWGAIYHTARAQTRKRNAHTEVKFNRVLFDKGARDDAAQALVDAGIAADDIVYKPRSQSISVHVK